MKIGLDLDGVFADFGTAFHTLLCRTCGDQFPPDYEPTKPPVWEWPRHFGYLKDAEDRAWKVAWDSEDFWYHLHTYPGEDRTLEVLEAWMDKHDMYFITNRKGNKVKWQTEQWLFEHGISFPTVLIAKLKEPIIAALNLDVYIDDNIDMMNSLAKLRDEKLVPETLRLYLRDAPYNEENRHPGLIVVPSAWAMIQKEGL